jgi:hypothetical protein
MIPDIENWQEQERRAAEILPILEQTSNYKFKKLGGIGGHSGI